MKLGSPLQRVGLGMVVVVAYAFVPAHPTPSWARYDVLADPLGWVLVVLGMVELARVEPAFSTARWLAVAAGVVSVPMWFPQLQHRLTPSGEWAASLPQVAFCLVLAHTAGRTAALQEPRDAYVAHRFGLLVWGYVVVAVLPVLTFGAGLTRLAGPMTLVSTLLNVVFVYYVFGVHRRLWLGGPGPLEVHPRTHEGRPPSR